MSGDARVSRGPESGKAGGPGLEHPLSPGNGDFRMLDGARGAWLTSAGRRHVRARKRAPRVRGRQSRKRIIPQTRIERTGLRLAGYAYEGQTA